ncbi:MAG: rhamnulokinase [Suipraeoptans sp.]
MEKKLKYYLAMDFGASTGRGILGSFDGYQLELKEVHRFENYHINQNGVLFWDIYRLFHEIICTIKVVRKELGENSLCSIGIDTWGTDYGLLDKNGQLLGNVRCMRDTDGKAVEEVVSRVGAKKIFDITGLQTLPGNTIFQLFERLQKKDPALMFADKMLMLPDLLGYFLTGVKKEEYTIATTSMCYNPRIKDWDYNLIEDIGLPTSIFTQISYPGEERIPLLPELEKQLSTRGLHYVNVGTHDTASAVAATPLEANELFCSSGTWSLMGVEIDEVIINEDVNKWNFTNEGTVDGKFRLLKNIIGMWLIQECMKEWKDMGLNLSWDEVVLQASVVKPFESFLDTDIPELYNAGNMIKKIQTYCRRTGQKVPYSVGELARCIYESIAMRYRLTKEQLSKIMGKEFTALRIVGGGCQNEMLNQFAANVLDLPVYSGPVEAASVGNLLLQCVADGQIKKFCDIREVVKQSFEIKIFNPQDTELWEDGYGRYCKIVRDK